MMKFCKLLIMEKRRDEVLRECLIAMNLIDCDRVLKKNKDVD